MNAKQAQRAQRDKVEGRSSDLPWEGARKDPDMRGQLTAPDDIRLFVLAGNATITLRSLKTGNRWTFKISKPNDFNPDRAMWFVSVLKGSDNEADFGYIGQLRDNPHPYYERGRKCWPTFHAASDAFLWFWRHLRERNAVPAQLEVWHEGRCGRCNRKLTVPSSIENGFGPECINHV
jgi:uncharacterized protein DUF6011